MPRSTKTFTTQAEKDRYTRNIEYYFKVEVPGKIVSMAKADHDKAVEMLTNYADTLSAVFVPHDYAATVNSSIPVPAVPAKK